MKKAPSSFLNADFIDMRKKNFHRLNIVLLGIIVLVAVLSMGGGNYLLNYALTPPRDIDPLQRADYQALYADYPYLRPWVDSLEHSAALRDTFLVNVNGVRLHALYVEAARPTKKTAVIVHGYTDSAVRMLMIAHLYNQQFGYNVLLPDLRYHGLSGGRSIGMGWFDRFDLSGWLEIANEIFGKDTKMVVHGISMGAATTMMLSGGTSRPYVKCFVEDCGFTNVFPIFKHKLKQEFGLPAFPLLYMASLACQVNYGWNFKEASALDLVQKSRLPMLFIHGEKDDYVPTKMVYSLYEAKPAPKELWIAPGSAHAKSYKDHPEEYARRVRKFLEKYIH